MTSKGLTPHERAVDLVASMSLEEKVAQLCSVWGWQISDNTDAIKEQLDLRLSQGIGHVSALATFGAKTPIALARVTNQVQKYLAESTRLGIPAIFHNETLTGVVGRDFSVFPTAIGLAATWSPADVTKMADLIRQQMRAVGLHQALAPVMDVARDARWGRVHETYGEEPYLAAAMSVAYTRGMQGDNLANGVIATGKHFLGFASAEGGQHFATTHLSNRDVRDVYARPFEAAIQLGGLESIMNSYSAINGEPPVASVAILRDLLRRDLGFTGTTVADYTSVRMLLKTYLVAETPEEAAALALNAGMDLDLPDGLSYRDHLASACRKGLVDESTIDEAVLRVLLQKERLGLFDNPYVAEEPIRVREIASAGADLALDLARRSMTLLKNEGGLLPLSRSVSTIAVVGPHATNRVVPFPAFTYPAAITLMGEDQRGFMAGAETFTGFDQSAKSDLSTADVPDYVYQAHGAVSLAEALRDQAPQLTVLSSAVKALRELAPDELQAAIDVASQADVVVLALGGQSGWFGDFTEGENGDSTDIALPAAQLELVNAISALGKPMIAVLFMGRPYAIHAVVESVPAILHAYFPGMRGTVAVAETILGKVNPGGKLPYSIPRSTGQVPIYSGAPNGSGYRRTADDLWPGYLDSDTTPEFPFGHGISYSTFAYSDLVLPEQGVTTDGQFTVAVTVHNTSDTDGDEVAQMYVATKVSGLLRPARELVGFTRFRLRARQAKRVTFTVDLSQLSSTGPTGELVFEPGRLKIWIGGSSDDESTSGSVEVVGDVAHFDRTRSHLSHVEVSELDAGVPSRNRAASPS
jgi:beta-glucosidase